MKKSWIQKRDEHEHPSVKKETDKGMMYISTPKEIDGMLKKIPKGKLTTPGIIADKLATKHGVDYTCPLTTGIFISVCANAAEEEMEMGKKDITPYWRVVKPPKGYLYQKYMGQKSKQKEYLEKEGFKIIDSGTKKGLMVENYEEYLMN